MVISRTNDTLYIELRQWNVEDGMLGFELRWIPFYTVLSIRKMNNLRAY